MPGPVSAVYRLSYLLLLPAVAAGCTNSADSVSLSGLAMGTTWSVEITQTRTGHEQLNRDITAILADINQKMSTYLEDSELSRINQAAAEEWIPLSDDMYRVVREALRIGMETGGAFDITIGPVVNLWGFGPEKHTTIPGDDDIMAALARTGPGKIELRSTPPALRKLDPEVYLDLSGIAKGYAVDNIADYLEATGIENYMVEVGGEIRARGNNVRGNTWRIGIEKPLINERAVERIIELDHIAMATSGDYRNYFEQDGVRYSHTIDPRTGRPLSHRLASVTVLHPSTMTADALATALLVLGPDQGFSLARQLGLAVFFIIKGDGDFTEKMTEPFQWFLAEK